VAPTNTNINNNVTINGYITSYNSLSFNKLLTISDTLVVRGDVSFGSLADGIVLEPGGLLIVFGNLTFGNKVDLANNSMIIVTGNVTFHPSGHDKYTGGGQMFVDGEVSGNGDADKIDESFADMEEQYPFINDFVTGKTTTLPVEFKYVLAEKVGSHVLIKWATASELNNDFFTVEKSQDGKNFETIGTVTGAGNSNTLLTYEFVDVKPQTGTQYYRVKQTDYDGQFDHSDIVSVSNSSQIENNKNSVTILTVGPNPFEEIFNVDFDLSTAGPVEVGLMNLNGSVVASEIIEGYTGGNRYTFNDTKGLEKGIYLLRLSQHNITSKAVRLMKR
jgi:hypothetical protein